MSAASVPDRSAGPSPAISLRVRTIQDIAVGCKQVVLASPDGRPLAAGEPGSHIGLRLPEGVERQYSLLRSQPGADAYEIAIKRDPASRGGSTFIHDHLQVGDVVMVEPPRNNFPLIEGAGASVFLAGGIGITPILCMIRRLRETGAPWTLHYACRTRAEAAFRDEFDGLANVHFHFDDEHDGRPLPIQEVLSSTPRRAHLYCCGPGPMLAAFEDAAAQAGIDSQFVRVEYFTQKYEASTEGGFEVELARSGLTVHVAPGRTILQAVLAAGVDMAWSCEEGFCGACETKVLAGLPDHRDAILSVREREASKTMFICCSGSKSERLVLDL
jgi:ferredoxin-NADP reductase